MSDKTALRPSYQQALRTQREGSDGVQLHPTSKDYEAFKAHAQERRRLRLIYFRQNRKKQITLLYNAISFFESTPEASPQLLTLHAYPFAIDIEGSHLEGLEDKLLLEQIVWIQEFDPARHELEGSEATRVSKIEVREVRQEVTLETEETEEAKEALPLLVD